MTPATHPGLETDADAPESLIAVPPAWIAAELPPEYAEIGRKIAELREQARAHEKFADILWRTGEPLRSGVREIFDALEFPAEPAPLSAPYDLIVELDPGKRLLLQVTASEVPLDKRSPQIARALAAIQQEAREGDRVVLVANIFCNTPVAKRGDAPAAADALRVLQGLGANLLLTPTLFGLWRLSLKDLPTARKSLYLLHNLDGGIYR